MLQSVTTDPFLNDSNIKTLNVYALYTGTPIRTIQKHSNRIVRLATAALNKYICIFILNAFVAALVAIFARCVRWLTAKSENCRSFYGPLLTHLHCITVAQL